MSLNEADTRARLIDPQLGSAHWGADQLSREHFYRRDVQYTPGRVVGRGTRSTRKKGRRVDYPLRYAGFPITVVEAKAEGESAESGFRQGQDYTRDLGFPFAYATDCHTIPEYDGLTRITVPALLAYEVANVLRYRADLTTGDIEVAVQALFDLDLALATPTAAVMRRAVALAREYDTTVYDATFVAVAEGVGAHFITADERLARRLAALPLVQFLGDVEIAT